MFNRPLATDDVLRQLRDAAVALSGEVLRDMITAGAERIKIVFRPENAAAKGLYLSVGFEPVKETAVFSRPASRPAT